MESSRLFYHDEYEARATAVSASGKTWQQFADHLYGRLMKPESAYAKFRARMNREGDQQFTAREDIAIMLFAGQYDLLYHLCDETSHARPPRIAPEDQVVSLAETMTACAETMRTVMAQIERLQPKVRR